MNSRNRSGYFITFESLDGLGKTDQIVRLTSFLTSVGCSVHVTKEPGDGVLGSSLGSSIRNMLFNDPGMHKIDSDAANLLLLADHIQNAHDIKDHLTEGKVVISDRYVDSQYAYWDPDSHISELYKRYEYPKPDLTIYLDPLYSSTGDLKWVFDRANTRSAEETAKQNNKSWNTLSDFNNINDAYRKHLYTNAVGRTSFIPVLSTDSKEEVFRKVLDTIKYRYGQINPKVYL